MPGTTRIPRSRVFFGDCPQRQTGVRRHLDRTRFRATFANGSQDWGDLRSFDLIVPFHKRDYAHLRTALSQGRCRPEALLIPAPGTVEMLEDKRALGHWMIEAGHRHWVPLWDGRFPCIVKEAGRNFGRGAHLVQCQDDLDRLRHATRKSMAVQRLIPGVWEFATHVAARSGRILSSHTRRYRMPGPDCIKGHAVKPIRMGWTPCPCPEAVATIIADLGYTGTCCIDYKMVEGAPKVFEINPRMGSSLPGRINAYLDDLARAQEAPELAATA